MMGTGCRCSVLTMPIPAAEAGATPLQPHQYTRCRLPYKIAGEPPLTPFVTPFERGYTAGVNAREVAKRWYQQAIHDLEMARRNLTIEGYDVAAFLAHQSVENMKKDLIIQRFIQHALPRICEQLKPERVIFYATRLPNLSRFSRSLQL